MRVECMIDRSPNLITIEQAALEQKLQQKTRNILSMRNFLLFTIALAPGSALAGSLPSINEFAAFAAPPPAFAWSGFYVGVNGGYGSSATNSTVYAEAVNGLNSGNPAIATSGVDSFRKSGGFGGGQIGYNFQRGQFVFGLEADIQGGDVRGGASAFATAVSSETIPGIQDGFHGGGFHGGGVLGGGVHGGGAHGGLNGNGSIFTAAASSGTFRNSGLDWFGAVRGRVGYAIGNAVIYATGGFAYGGVSGKASTTLSTASGFPAGAHTYSVDTGATLAGYTVGAGLEYALTPQWSVKAEYQYIDLGRPDYGYVGYHEYINGPFGPVEVRARGYYGIEQNFNIVRVGLNYRFGALDAAIANY